MFGSTTDIQEPQLRDPCSNSSTHVLMPRFCYLAGNDWFSQNHWVFGLLINDDRREASKAFNMWKYSTYFWHERVRYWSDCAERLHVYSHKVSVEYQASQLNANFQLRNSPCMALSLCVYSPTENRFLMVQEIQPKREVGKQKSSCTPLIGTCYTKNLSLSCWNLKLVHKPPDQWQITLWEDYSGSWTNRIFFIFLA